MKKQELIKHIEDLPYSEGLIVDTIKISRKGLLELVSQLDEPQKVKIPQFVADWLSNLKSGLFGLNYDSVPSEIYDWVYATEDNLRKLHLASVYSYEVEEEKRYQVVMPNVSSSGGVLTRIKHDDSWIWIDTLGTIVEGRTHTRKELEEANFGWVFDCPGIEIEEV